MLTVFIMGTILCGGGQCYGNFDRIKSLGLSLRPSVSRLASVLFAPVLVAMLTDMASGAAYVLSNGPGDGTVTVGVDGFGAFGSAVGVNSSNAVYDPVGGSPSAAGTVFESGVAIRFGSSGPRSFLTSGDIGNSGRLMNPTVIGSTTGGTSSFSFGGLNFNLTQSLIPLFNGAIQSGSVLTQTYLITNPGQTATDFELLRYVDGDLVSDGSLIDGGGRLDAGSSEILFQTDSATGSLTATFLGITAEGGTSPPGGRYEIDAYSSLCMRVVAGMPLSDSVTGDGGDLDQFVDAGGGYDVTLALNNVFSLDPGASTRYQTTTIFGVGTPEWITTSAVPEAGGLLIPFAAVFGILIAANRLVSRRSKHRLLG
jgi:hypothetical protein